VFKNEKDMQILLEFLVISLKTYDGVRGSAEKLLKKMNKFREPKQTFSTKLKGLFCTLPNLKQNFISDDASFEQEQQVYLQILKYLMLMKVRMKISFMALIKKMTVRELFLWSIARSFK
jgi:hypothetical protein